jgi:predicted phosphodiesterase
VRYLILSDIHSNDEALGAVLGHVRRKKFQKVVLLGDFVGYGANPNNVIDRIRKLKREKIAIRGNHDKVVVGADSGELFNSIALYAARWTEEKLSPVNRKYLETLPIGPAIVDRDFAVCHGSPLDEDAYIVSDVDAYMNFRSGDWKVCFFGHSHIPSVFTLEKDAIRVEVVRGERTRLALDPKKRYLINPGSIGQPRDRNPQAAYAIFDSDERVVFFDRVDYDVDLAREKILRAGLPAMLGDRLPLGQ